MATYKKDLKYRINLVDTFESAFKDKPTEVKDQLRRYLSDNTFKIAYGEAVVNEIVKRTTEKSIDKNDDPFPKYTPEYKKSRIYKLYGKTPKVNLTLTGNMMNNLVPQKSSTEVIVGFANESEAAKADSHINTSRVKRDFLGLPDEVAEKIMRKIISGMSTERAMEEVTDFIPASKENFIFSSETPEEK